MIKKDSVSVVGIQVAPTTDRDYNLKHALSLVDDAIEKYEYIDLICLPEYFYLDPDDRIVEIDSIQEYPQEIIEEFSKRAKKANTYIAIGTVANRREGKLYNTCIFLDRNGEIAGRYDKVHLFDALGIKESDAITPGNDTFIFDTDFGRIGMLICYDVRFPEYARSLALQGVKYFIIPAAFYSPRIDHWPDLVQSIALQNLSYALAVNLVGKVIDGEVFCGRSLIVDPWGVRIAMASDKACHIQSYLYPDYIDEIRQKVASYDNRVPALYHCGQKV